MKINTDGVLLGTMAYADHPNRVLDIGTGTGVIALMLAQRFGSSKIDAVEIDEAASETAGKNFEKSPFANKLSVHRRSIESFFVEYPDLKYDFIVSNPPFYINSLESPTQKKSLAKHANASFFERLLKSIAGHLSLDGLCWLILPIKTGELVKTLIAENAMYLHKIVCISSFENDEPHREVLAFGLQNELIIKEKFIIYDLPKVYSEGYKALLKDFLTIF